MRFANRLRPAGRARLAGPAVLIAVLATLATTGTSAAAVVAPAPALSIRSEALPSDISPSSGGQVALLVTNAGGAETNGQPLTVSDAVPAGLTITAVFEKEVPEVGPFACTHTSSTVSCTYSGALPSDDRAGLYVSIELAATPGKEGVLAPANLATAGGGGAATVSSADTLSVAAGEPPAGFYGPFSSNVFDAGGALDTQAGDHPNTDTTEFALTTTARLDLDENRGIIAVYPVQKMRDVTVTLPPGLVGNPQAAATCPQYLVAPPDNGKDCPPSSVIGTIAIDSSEGSWTISEPASGTGLTKPIFNVPPEGGHPAQFAFILANQEVTLYAKLARTGAGYVVEVNSPLIPRFLRINQVKITFFGAPELIDQAGGTTSAFFTNPTDCADGPLTTNIYMDTWESPGRELPDGSPDLSDPNWHIEKSVAPAPTGCQNLTFAPEFEAKPTTKASGSPSGLDVNLTIPQNTDPTGLATPELKDVTVTLPEGLTISPSSANGLQACSEAQFAAESTEPSTCPQASAVGSVKVHTPLLKEELEGQVFVGAPECSPCSNGDAQAGRMVRLFIEIANAKRGVDVKLPGTVSLDPSTGQLTATFKESPQLPFDHLEFTFKDGEDAPLSTPTSCGGYASAVDLTPWSTPYTKDAVLDPGFEIKEGCGARGFAPSFTAGNASSQAGAYTPFTLTLSRNDSEQYVDDLEQTLPPGLLAKLAGVPRCGEAEANAGACPEGSRIGSVTVGAGPGNAPFYTTGSIYLTGPYNGGPFGEVVEVPAVAGPFNLGVVAVRGSIRVNPNTVQATVVSNPFPSILDGIPLQVKTVNVTLDRPGFTFNPTSCGALAVTGRLVSTQGASAAVSTPFVVQNCAVLGFKPVFSASVAGKASKANGASLTVRVAYPSGPFGSYANIKSVKVDLPVQLPSRLSTLQKACLAKVFEADPASCPSASDVGTASATTPLLNVPVSGPAYLVSHGGEAFPDLEIVLQGEGVTLVLVGNTQIKKGVTSSTFKAIPDAPVSGFELKLPTGKYSILGANVPQGARYSLCGQSLSIPTVITGQNGTVIKQATKIGITGCTPTRARAKKAVKRKPGEASKAKRRGGR